MITESLRRVVVEAGLTPDHEDLGKVAEAIRTGGKALGEPFPVWDHLAGVEPPSNSGSVQYIKLTAGEDGSGQYNEGLLTNETVSGSGSLIEITAEIVSGPMAGQTVNLVNSENRYLMPGESSGATGNDQMQQIIGSGGPFVDSTQATFSGALTEKDFKTLPVAGASSITATSFNFDSADSPDARTGDHTNVKHTQATYYMRIA
jgi:hypothetical protein